MPSMNRRAFLTGTSAALLGASGCLAEGSATTPAHWVTVYLVDHETPRDVTVTVTDDRGDVLFEQDYQLSATNQADEDVPFPESTEPETVVVTVDGTRFERDWPGFEQRELPCDSDTNYSGVELWIENARDGSPTVRLEAGCQHVTME
jgi:hypothetical protein